MNQYQPFYYSDKFNIVISNHEVYAIHQTIYDEIFNALNLKLPKHVIKLCEERRFTKLDSYKITPNIPEYISDLIRNNITNSDLGALRKYICVFRYKQSNKFWDIIDSNVREGIRLEVNESILGIPQSYFTSLINSKHLDIEAYINKNKLTPGKLRYSVNPDSKKLLLYLVNKYKIDMTKYMFDLPKARNRFKKSKVEYTNIYRYKFNTNTDLMFAKSYGEYSSRYENSKYLITYSDKTDILLDNVYDVVYTPNVVYSNVVAHRFMYSLDEKYFLGLNDLNYEPSLEPLTKSVRCRNGKTFKKQVSRSIQFKKYDEQYTYSKYLSDLCVNESNLIKNYINEHSPEEVYNYDYRKDLKDYEIFKEYTRDSNSIVLLIHHLICYQNIKPKDEEIENKFKNIIYNLYQLEMKDIIDIVNTCALSKIQIQRKEDLEKQQPELITAISNEEKSVVQTIQTNKKSQELIKRRLMMRQNKK